ncbi:MAG: hypothetical protein L3J87_03795 [Thermoplasmata archaeon]|nr:hypothetical protein [Thermoplasmata archaeon]
MQACILGMSSADTSVRVSRETLRRLNELRTVFGTGSVDETIQKLLRERRRRALNRLFGSGKGVVSKFTEEGRLESHY